MNRRAFIYSGALFIPAFPAIVRAQIMPTQRRAVRPPPVASGSSGATFKQYLANENQTAASSTVATGPFNVASGDLVIAMVAGEFSVSGVSIDGQALTSIRAVGTSGSYRTELWYLANASADASATLTATFSSSAEYRHISGLTYSGVSTSSPLDGSNNNSISDATWGYATTSTNRTAQNITTTNANDLLIGLWLNWNSAQVGTAAATWTKRSGTGSQMATFVTKEISSTGTHPSGNFGTVPSSDEYIGFISAWKLA